MNIDELKLQVCDEWHDHNKDKGEGNLGSLARLGIIAGLRLAAQKAKAEKDYLVGKSSQGDSGCGVLLAKACTAETIESAILALIPKEASEQPTAKQINNTMLYVLGSKTAHRCECGCNVYNKLDSSTYQCNSCGDLVYGECTPTPPPTKAGA